MWSASLSCWRENGSSTPSCDPSPKAAPEACTALGFFAWTAARMPASPSCISSIRESRSAP